MAGISLGFKDSQELMRLYRDLPGTSAEKTAQSLDRSLPTIDYSKYALGQKTSPDQWVQAEELFFSVARNPDYHRAYQRFAKKPLPWKPTRKSRAVLREFDDMVEFWRELNPEKEKLSLALAQEIFRWVTRPESKDGLGIKYDSKAPEQTFDEVVQSKRGECTEFTYVLVALFTRAGFKVTPMWVGKDNDGRVMQHAVAGLELGGKTYTMDATIRKFDAGYRYAIPSSLGQTLAWYWNNVAYKVKKSHPGLEEKYYRRAQSMDPRNPYFPTNLGVLYLDRGEAKKAEAYFRAALKITPDFPKALEGLGDIHFLKKDFRKALPHFRASIASDPHRLPVWKKLVRAAIGVEDKKVADQNMKSMEKWVKENRVLLEPAKYRDLIQWMTRHRNIVDSL